MYGIECSLYSEVSRGASISSRHEWVPDWALRDYNLRECSGGVPEQSLTFKLVLVLPEPLGPQREGKGVHSVEPALSTHHEHKQKQKQKRQQLRQGKSGSTSDGVRA